MKRIATTLLTLMLVIGMVFGAAPSAFADEPPPQLPPPDAVGVEMAGQTETAPIPGQPSTEQATQSQEQAINEETAPIETNTLTEEPVPATVPPESDPTLTTASPETEPELSLLTHEPACDPFEPADTMTDDQYHALMELHQALDELYGVIYSSPDLSIIRVDSGSLNEEYPSVRFEEGACCKEILPLINRINELLEECGFSSSPFVCSLPISVVGELPEGFVFCNNTLTLVNPEVLLWNEDLDEPDAMMRSFYLELQLSTGINSLDNWLACQGLPNLTSDVFLIELELIPPRDTGGPPIPPIDPVDPGPPVDPDPPINPDPPVDPTTPTTPTTPITPTTPTAPTTPDTPPDTTGGSGSVPYVAPEGSVSPASNTTTTSTAAVAVGPPKTVPTEDPAQNPFEPPANGLDLSIEAQKIPTASMMMSEESNALVINGVMVTLSLVLGAVSLGSLRLQKKGSTPQLDITGSNYQRAGFVAGVSGIGLAAISATLFVVSQYVVSDSLGASGLWTPILITVFVAQAACQTTVIVTKRIEVKRADPRRFKVRY